MGDNLFPNVTAVIEEINQVHKGKIQLVENEIKLLRNLLKPVLSNSNAIHHSPGYSKQKLLQPKRTSLDSPKIKPKQHNLRNSSSPILSLKNSAFNSDVVTNENICPETEAVFCKLDHLIKRGLAKELKDCIGSVKEYIDFRGNSDNKSEVERQKYLLWIESSWEEEFKTLQIFEPDLADSLFKYLKAIEVKESEPKLPECLNNKIMSNEEITEEAENIVEEVQEKIIVALCEDLNNIDLDKIKSEGNVSLAVKLYETVIALSNIQRPKTPIFFKKNPHHEALLEGFI